MPRSRADSRKQTPHDTCSLEEAMASLEASRQEFLEKQVREAEQRQMELTKAGYTPELIAELEEESRRPEKKSRARRGYTSRTMVERAQMRLFDMEEEGRFTAYPLEPQQEYPTLFTRVPLFLPVRERRSQLSLVDEEMSIPFETSWCYGWKYGPPLTIFDEDTFIALGRLRQQRLSGHPDRLPIRESCSDTRGAGEVHVHALYCTVTDVMRMCGPTTDGGNNFKARHESIIRLGNVMLDIRPGRKDDLVKKGRPMPLIHLLWESVGETALCYVQFPPQMAEWYTNAYSYIDWDVRKELSFTGKAIHRFLSGQPKSYQIGTKKLMSTIRYMGEYRDFMRAARAALTRMEKLGWLGHWEVVGTGRVTPQKFVIERT